MPATRPFASEAAEEPQEPLERDGVRVGVVHPEEHLAVLGREGDGVLAGEADRGDRAASRCVPG